jgi:hypothetical protein
MKPDIVAVGEEIATALGGTAAAYPTALNFGTGAGAIDSTLNPTLSNIGTVSDTYSIGVQPVGDSPAPALSTNTVEIDPGGSQPLSATVNASGLAAGEYQGYLQVTGTANSNVTTIRYWFAVPGSTPARSRRRSPWPRAGAAFAEPTWQGKSWHVCRGYAGRHQYDAVEYLDRRHDANCSHRGRLRFRDRGPGAGGQSRVYTETWIA